MRWWTDRKRPSHRSQAVAQQANPVLLGETARRGLWATALYVLLAVASFAVIVRSAGVAGRAPCGTLPWRCSRERPRAQVGLSIAAKRPVQMALGSPTVDSYRSTVAEDPSSPLDCPCTGTQTTVRSVATISTSTNSLCANMVRWIDDCARQPGGGDCVVDNLGGIPIRILKSVSAMCKSAVASVVRRRMRGRLSPCLAGDDAW